MEQRTYRAAIIAADGSVRDRLRGALRSHPRVETALEIGTPLEGLTDVELRRLREADPELVLVDLSADPGVGVRFARHLTESNAARRVIGFGPGLDSEVLLAAMRAGVCEYLRLPFEAAELDAALGRVLRLLEAPAGDPKRPGRVYAFFAAKGGVGVTTLATNIAIELRRLTGRPTLLLDLDIELGEAALVLGLEPRHTLVDVARNVHRLDPELLASYVERHASGLHVLAAPLHPAPGEAVGADPVRALLGFLRRQYAFVVVDAARATAPHALAAIERAERAFAVADPDLSSLRNLKRCTPLLARAVGHDPDRIRLILNRYEAVAPISPGEVEAALGLPVHRTLGEDREAATQAAADRKPLVLHASSPLARQIREFAAELAGFERDPRGGRRGVARTLATAMRGLRRRFTRDRAEAIAHD